jgi:hypothetical protein
MLPDQESTVEVHALKFKVIVVALRTMNFADLSSTINVQKRLGWSGGWCPSLRAHISMRGIWFVIETWDDSKRDPGREVLVTKDAAKIVPVKALFDSDPVACAGVGFRLLKKLNAFLYWY